MEPNERILDKIRKLQALSERATTEAEAALAAARVQELVTKHNLDLGAVLLKEDPGAQMEAGEAWKRLAYHAQSLAEACALMFDVLFFFRGSKMFGHRFVFIGLTDNVQAACITYEYLYASVDALARGAKNAG